MLIIVRGVGKLPTNFVLSGTYLSRLMGQQLSYGPHDIATVQFDFGGIGAARDATLNSFNLLID